MPDRTDPEGLYADAEPRFARWIANLGGWCFDMPGALTDDERQIANDWVDAGLLHQPSKDGHDAFELTAAGWAWYRQNTVRPAEGF